MDRKTKLPLPNPKKCYNDSGLKNEKKYAVMSTRSMLPSFLSCKE